jgi:exodeoxyribonuclease V alpha subunit
MSFRAYRHTVIIKEERRETMENENDVREDDFYREGDPAVLEGTYGRTRMRDRRSGFTIFELNTKENGVIVCKGTILGFAAGTPIKVTGVWVRDPKWGLQTAEARASELDRTEALAAEYLTGVQGIGMTTANAIIAEIGTKLAEFAARPSAADELMRIRGITREKAEAVVHYVRKTEEQKRLFDLVTKNGGSYASVMRIFGKHGESSVPTLLRDPYTEGLDAGLPFAVCDRLALSAGMSPSSPLRVFAASSVTLERAAQNGHSFLPFGALAEGARKMLGVSREETCAYVLGVCSPIISSAAGRDKGKRFVKEGGNVYIRRIRQAECGAAKSILRLIKAAEPARENAEKLCAHAEKTCGVVYADKQRDAFSLLSKSGVGIITGGPGTGKTTVIKGLLAAYEKLYPKAVIKLAAPTGRAAGRMKEATGREAQTIHKLLEYRPYDGEMKHKSGDDPIEADLLFIDEVSMLSVELANTLFSAIKTGTMVLIAGDEDQLPAVGAGNVLADMIRSGFVPCVRLTKTYRQAEGSLIIKNAGMIRDGYPNIGKGKDFEIVTVPDAGLGEAAKSEFVRHYKKDDPFSAQVLTMKRRKSKKDTANAAYLNDLLQSTVNGEGEPLRFGDSKFRVADKVMTMRNNYGAGYCNGDIGVVTRIGSGGVTVRIDGRDVVIDDENLEDLSLAYATTVHKSQGSEYGTAIIVLASEPRSMLQRNLLYTAVTRAKEKVVLITAEGAVTTAVRRKDASKRNSNLAERIKLGMQGDRLA